ncbi:hypothetical protein Tel_14780 [Candidatus Tenderia electrophaga]|mgnify:CR=1 FL=1|jgi:general secretion pathway protein K|uniref:Type II secretion system protein K n=1 Tax=Candidatus Tenderia electrophaga TaxID=1748243 RepID=A0A0S2TGQ0_9GAMM|nr:hypothetical protein Tel_14780 [Candidatus Tenderia electrophaga]
MRRQQQGVALITAVLIVALVTAAAVAMAARQQVDIRRSANIFSNDQAYLFALGGEDYARNVLQFDADPNKGDPNVDHLGEFWAQPASFPVEGATLSGSVKDMQGRFNLNALVDSGGRVSTVRLEQFIRLLQLLDLNQDLADGVVDWIDSDSTPQFGPLGAEDDYYMLQDPPYRAANTLMKSASELRLIRGVDDETYQKLIPLVTALPVADTAINVNTAPAEVLAALVGRGSVSLADGAGIVEEREGKEFASIADFNHRTGNSVDISIADVKSSYFRVDAVAEFDQTRARLHSLLRRDGAKVEVLMRSRGSY